MLIVASKKNDANTLTYSMLLLALSQPPAPKPISSSTSFASRPTDPLVVLPRVRTELVRSFVPSFLHDCINRFPQRRPSTLMALVSAMTTISVPLVIRKILDSGSVSMVSSTNEFNYHCERRKWWSGATNPYACFFMCLFILHVHSQVIRLS